jgi:hypothetical protein
MISYLIAWSVLLTLFGLGVYGLWQISNIGNRKGSKQL